MQLKMLCVLLLLSGIKKSRAASDIVGLLLYFHVMLSIAHLHPQPRLSVSVQ